MERMRHKWQYFVIGFLSGFLLVGITTIVIAEISDSKQAKLVRDIKETSISYSTSVTGTKESKNPDEYLGKIDINHASIEELMSLPNIGETKAKAIIKFREKYGSFQSIDELMYVSGIGDEVFSELADLIYIQE